MGMKHLEIFKGKIVGNCSCDLCNSVKDKLFKMGEEAREKVNTLHQVEDGNYYLSDGTLWKKEHYGGNNMEKKEFFVHLSPEEIERNYKKVTVHETVCKKCNGKWFEYEGEIILDDIHRGHKDGCMKKDNYCRNCTYTFTRTAIRNKDLIKRTLVKKCKRHRK